MTTVTAEWIADVGCVEVTVSAIANPPPDGSALVERSYDLVRWTPVRGAQSVEILPDVGTLAVPVYDCEPVLGATVHYRVSFLDAGGVPTGQTATSGPFVVPLPDQDQSLADGCDLVWVKFPRTPGSNQLASAVGPVQQVTREGRVGVFDVIGRPFPVGVTDLMQSRQWALATLHTSRASADRLEQSYATGDVVFLHTTPGHPTIPDGGAYWLVLQLARDVVATDWPDVPPDCPRELQQVTVQLRQVADAGTALQPGALAQWACVPAVHDTWADVEAAYGTWLSLLQVLRCP